MPSTLIRQFDSPLFKGTVTVNTGLFINGQFVDPINEETIEYVTYF